MSRQTAWCTQLAHRAACTVTRSGRQTWRRLMTVQQLRRVWRIYGIPATYQCTLHLIIQVRLSQSYRTPQVCCRWCISVLISSLFG